MGSAAGGRRSGACFLLRRFAARLLSAQSPVRGIASSSPGAGRAHHNVVLINALPRAPLPASRPRYRPARTDLSTRQSHAC